MKEKIISVSFSQIPNVRVRVIDADDILELKKNKKKYPFELQNSVDVLIVTTKRNFSFTIYNGYTWNGADIPRFFWRIIGSRTDNDFLIASMLHDYLLEFKSYVISEILKNQIKKKEYRRLTSLIFRHIIKEQGTNTIKANVMSWCVDVFQMFNWKAWKSC
ncbi:MAG: DUF1353 domain-containing protein [Candidatus Gastranaerophilales bacterium]|nr:DUF1353 domain-containing protein [Candidatus Gastranaerophilales bacterium]